MNGCQLAVTTNAAPAAMNTRTTATLIMTMMTLTRADSLTPRINSAVMAATTAKAGKLNTAVTDVPSAAWTTLPGEAVSDGGR